MWAKFIALVALLLFLSGCAWAPRPGSIEEQLWFLRAVGPHIDPYYSEHEQAIVLRHTLGHSEPAYSPYD